MNETTLTGLDRMTTAEIAEALDARKFLRGFHHRLLCIARKGAFSWFVVQYLLFVGVNPVWIVPTAICLLIAELRTNRFTMNTYSTYEIVDLLTKRNTLEETRSDALKKLAPGFFLFVIGAILAGSGAPFYWHHVFIISGLVWVLIGFKSIDNIKSIKNDANFCHIEAEDGRYYLEVRHGYGPNLNWTFAPIPIMYLGLAISMAYPFLVHMAGGLASLQGVDHMTIGVLMVFSGFGCMGHETMRFHLAHRELNRLKEIEKPGVRNAD